MLIDTHCHLDFERFDSDRDDVIARAVEAGVHRIIVPSLEPDNARKVLNLVEGRPPLLAAVGVHPNSAAGWEDDWVDEVRRLAAHPKVVAIGEIGLDYYREWSPPTVQRHAFASQLNLAAELNLPVIIHNREASNDVLALLAASPLRQRTRAGVLHSFSGSWETARTALDLGFYLGFTGPVTFPKAEALRDIVARAPLDRLLVETDAPFLAPQAHRGKRNEPAFVAFVVERIAQVRGLPTEEVARATSANAERLFGEQLVVARASQ